MIYLNKSNENWIRDLSEQSRPPASSRTNNNFDGQGEVVGEYSVHRMGYELRLDYDSKERYQNSIAIDGESPLSVKEKMFTLSCEFTSMATFVAKVKRDQIKGDSLAVIKNFNT